MPPRTSFRPRWLKFRLPLTSSPPLEAVRARLRRDVAPLECDRYLHPDMEKATDLIKSGAIIDTVGAEYLPALDRRITA